jgi:hypothetical protein
MYSNMFIFVKCEKLWDFICRFLHKRMSVAGSFHLAFSLTAITRNTGVQILCQIYYKYDKFPIKYCLHATIRAS